MFPLRVAVETVRGSQCVSCAHDGQVLMDTYAVVAETTLLGQLVDTVLSALGHGQLAINARGLVQVNNWKALTFDQITDNMEDTVNNLFKDITGQITLRILTKPTSTDSASAQCVSDLKQRLMQSAMAKTPQLLNNVDNSQIKDVIRQIVAGNDPELLSHDHINAINDWLETIDTGRRSPVTHVRFHSVHEVPKLERWFKSDPNPSRQKMLQYVNILNTSSYRKNTPKITYQQMCNWFSNQRANRRPALQTTTQNTLNQISQDFQLSQFGHMTSLQQLTQLSQLTPQQLATAMPSLLADFRPKLDFSNLIEACQKTGGDSAEEMRMDGGSDSPNPADDEIHSNSDGPVDFPIKQIMELQESTASSPDMALNIANSVAGSSPMHVSHTPDMNSHNPGLAMTGSQSARSRLMFDPLTELPILEKWFEENPHPTWVQIDQYTQMLNSFPYRENYPHISTHNVKIWFKNRRAKCKRMQTGLQSAGLKLENLFA